MFYKKLQKMFNGRSVKSVLRAGLHLLILFALFQLPAYNAKIQASAEVTKYANSEVGIELKELDPRAQILQDYLYRYNSPMAYHAQDFIDAADTYNLDWKLVPAITGVESTFGKHVPGGLNPQTCSYNGWGWGVYGTQAIYFESWREGIFTVSKGLRERYFDRGLTNPYSINRVYAASKSWGTKVTFFLNDLAEFERNYPKFQKSEVALYPISLKSEEAGNSAELYSLREKTPLF